MTKKRPQVIRTIEEFDEWAPILAAELRDCAGCGEPTYWIGRGQRTKGRCPDCAPRTPTAPAVLAELDRRAERLLLENFPGTTIEFSERPPDTRPRWLLLRMFWPRDRRWDQRWIWCSPAEATPLMRKGWDA